MKTAVVTLWLAFTLYSQGTDSARREEARALAVQLTGDALKDAGVLATPGAADLFGLLRAPGLSPGATAQESVDLHLGFRGLAELEIAAGHLLKASVYEAFQESFYRKTHEYEAALAAARRGLDLAERSGEKGTAYLNHLAIGHNLLSLGRGAEALEEFRVARPLLPEPAGDVAGTLGRETVQTLVTLGRLAEAQNLLTSLQTQIPVGTPLFRLRVAFAHSDILFAQLHFAEGVEMVRKSLSLVAVGPERNDALLEANQQLLTGLMAGVEGLRYEEALELAKRAEAEIPGLLVPLQTFTELLVRRRRLSAGDIEEVLRDVSLNVENARTAGNVYGQIEALQALAGAYASVNGTREQVALLEEALRLEEPLLPPGGVPSDGGSQLSFYRTLDGLGWAYAGLSQPAPARRAFERILKGIATYPDVDTQERLRNFRQSAAFGKARVAELSDDPEEARALLLAELKAGSGPGSEALLQLARFERRQEEKFELAADYYERAIAALGAEHALANQMGTRLAFARFLLTKGAIGVLKARERARLQLTAVEEVLPTLHNAESEWRLHFLKGILLEATAPGQAVDEYTAAVARLDSIRTGMTQQSLRQGLLDDDSITELYSRFVALLTRMAEREMAWQYLERGKARSFLDLLGGRRFLTAGDAPETGTLASLERELENLRFKLAPENANVLRGAGQEPALLTARLKAVEQQFAVARQQTALRASRGGQVLSVVPPALPDAARRLPGGTALIEYGLLEGSITAFVVSREAARQITWAADTVELRRNVLRLRRSLANPASTDIEDLIAKVSAILLTPLASAVPTGTGNLIIVPTAYLNYLPFSVLTLPDGSPVLARYAVGFLPSAGALQYLHARKRGLKNLFLGALGNQSSGGMPPLPGTLKEAAAIRSVSPAAQYAVGPEFTHNVMRDALLRNENVHFATHGLLNEEAPLFSALLTGNAAGQPSRFSLYEITGLSIKARMVVLSACETGLGKLAGGDEVSGLTRTFLTAGADTVVSSLWKVSDDSTALLMTHFYRELSHNGAPAESLRKAALAVRKQFPHPFYWAPFIVTGVN